MAGAEHGAAAFTPFIDASLQQLAQAVGHLQARAPVNASPTDNMISALGKIALCQQRPELLGQWLGLLPLTRGRGFA